MLPLLECSYPYFFLLGPRSSSPCVLESDLSMGAKKGRQGIQLARGLFCSDTLALGLSSAASLGRRGRGGEGGRARYISLTTLGGPQVGCVCVCGGDLEGRCGNPRRHQRSGRAGLLDNSHDSPSLPLSFLGFLFVLLSL